MALAKKIDHIAIAVKDLDTAIKTYTTNFGFPVVSQADLPGIGIRLANLQVGDVNLELFTPTRNDIPPAKELAERGEGVFVLSLEVDDLEAAISQLRAKNIKVGEISPTGDGKGRLVYVSRKATHGVLLQLIEWPKG
jgi:methylmalonyl-CoA epimerase